MTDEEILRSYMFIRLSNVENDESAVKRQLNGEIGNPQDLLGFVKREDNSWELVVHRLSVAKICKALEKNFPSCHLQLDDDPLQPDQAMIDSLGHRRAQSTVYYEFSKRMREHQWILVRKFYELRYNQE